MQPKPIPAQTLAAAAMLLDLPPARLAQVVEAARTPAEKPKIYMHPEQAARKWGVCRATVLRHLRTGRIPGEKIGTQWRVLAEG